MRDPDNVAMTDTPDRLRVPVGTGWTSTLWRNALPLAIILAVAAALHFSFGAFDLASPSHLAITVAIAITLAVSLNLVNGFTGQFSIGHAGFMALGGYAAAAITFYGSIKLFGTAAPPRTSVGILSYKYALGEFSGPLFSRPELLFLGSVLIGGIVAAVAGLAVGLPSLRLKGDYLAIVTLGFGEIVRVLIESSRPQITGTSDVQAASFGTLWRSLGGALTFARVPQYTTIFWSFLVAGLTVLVALRVKNSSLGRAYLSIRENEIAAEAMGVYTTRYKVQAFVLSAFFAGLAGALYAHQQPIKAGDLNFMKSFDVIILIVLGGLGSISGAVIAAVVLTLLPEWLRSVPGVQQYRLVIYALLLVVVMILRPAGLLGTRELWNLWPFTRRKVTR